MGRVLKRNKYLEYLLIALGTTILALGINVFFEKHELVTGGVTGLAIVIKKITEDTLGWGIPLSVTNLVVNIPLFIIGTLIKGRHFGGKSLFATFFLSFALYFTKYIPSVTDDLLISSIFGGVLSGVGLGMVFYAYATTGGTDLAASIVQHYIKHISVAKIMFVIDAGIILLGLFVFGIEKAMYAIIAIYITVKVIDNILDGIHFSKAVLIISDNYEQISNELLVKLDRGITALNGKGMFTKKEKNVLLCVVSKKQVVKLKEIVRNIDSSAFIIVADVREVLGEGFKEYNL